MIINKRGSIILITLLILTSILTISFGAASLIVPGIIMNRLQINSTIAYMAAEAGAERSLWEVRKNNFVLPDFDQADIFTRADLGNGAAYNVDYASSSPLVTFTSIGSYRDSRRSVEVSFSTE